MPRRELRTVVDGGAFFESPRWHGGCWWVSDFYRHAVLTVEDGKVRRVLDVEGQPSGLGWLPDDTLLVVSMRDRRVLHHAGGDTQVHADLSGHADGHLNDMVVDGSGRAYVGSFGYDLMGGDPPRAADLVRVDPDGSITVAAQGLRFPNGSIITPDGTTLIVAESGGRRLTSFTIGTDGGLRDRCVWAQLGPTERVGPRERTIAPDGCCLDAEGRVWVADADGAGVFLIGSGGTVHDHIEPPEGLAVFACMLGGPDRRTLLMCCAPDFVEERREDRRESVLFSTIVDVPGAGLP